jgi:hypothetical protein
MNIIMYYRNTYCPVMHFYLHGLCQHETEKTSAWAAERESRIPGYFYTAIERLGPNEYNRVVGSAKTTTSVLLLVFLFYYYVILKKV